jgi:hypothetical protein
MVWVVFTAMMPPVVMDGCTLWKVVANQLACGTVGNDRDVTLDVCGQQCVSPQARKCITRRHTIQH